MHSSIDTHLFLVFKFLASLNKDDNNYKFLWTKFFISLRNLEIELPGYITNVHWISYAYLKFCLFLIEFEIKGDPEIVVCVYKRNTKGFREFYEVRPMGMHCLPQHSGLNF